MTPEILGELAKRHAAICSRWEVLLRIEPVPSAVGLPETLAHLIPISLGVILHGLRNSSAARTPLENARATPLPACGCGCNPYTAYFRAGEQAMAEAMVLLQSGLVERRRDRSDVASVICATRGLAASEIETFCSLCVRRGGLAACRFHGRN